MFFFTDIHGDLPMYHTILDWCLQRDSNCTIIFGGDACDRGPDGYALMKEMLANPRIVYLKGNHESMFVDAAKAMLQMSQLEAYKHAKNKNQYFLLDSEVHFSVTNGGMSTLMEWWDKESDKENFIKQIDSLPLVYSYNQYDFCHAGGPARYFTKVQNNEKISSDIEYSLLWDRSCLDKKWNKGRICVHGHTPQLANPFLTANHRLNMDLGVFDTKKIAVLDANNNEITIFSSLTHKPIQTYIIEAKNI